MSTKAPAARQSRGPDARRRADAADPAFVLEDSPFFVINQVAGAYAHAMERSLKAIGADIPRWRILMLAHERGPISVGEIASLAVLKLPTATKVVQRLTAEGLLSVARSEKDARVTLVTCTTSGAAVVEQVREVASQRFHEAFRAFTGRDIDDLNGQLRRVLQNLKT
jgi:DNA-binding MarR family transcriptional regulator